MPLYTVTTQNEFLQQMDVIAAELVRIHTAAKLLHRVIMASSIWSDTPT
jgi:hypothetical protein